MKAIDFIIVTYFAIFKKYGVKGLEAGIYVLIFPLTYNILSLIFYLTYLINNNARGLINPIIIVVLGLFIIFPAKKLLNNNYLGKFEQMKIICDKYPRILLVLFPIVHLPVSIFLGVYCLKFT
jgi:hypothetical protein